MGPRVFLPESIGPVGGITNDQPILGEPTVGIVADALSILVSRSRAAWSNLGARRRAVTATNVAVVSETTVGYNKIDRQITAVRRYGFQIS